MCGGWGPSQPRRTRGPAPTGRDGQRRLPGFRTAAGGVRLVRGLDLVGFHVHLLRTSQAQARPKDYKPQHKAGRRKSGVPCPASPKTCGAASSEGRARTRTRLHIPQSRSHSNPGKSTAHHRPPHVRRRRMPGSRGAAAPSLTQPGPDFATRALAPKLRSLLCGQPHTRRARAAPRCAAFSHPDQSAVRMGAALSAR